MTAIESISGRLVSTSIFLYNNQARCYYQCSATGGANFCCLVTDQSFQSQKLVEGYINSKMGTLKSQRGEILEERLDGVRIR